MTSDSPLTNPGSEIRRDRSLIADLDAVVWEADPRSLVFTFVSEGSSDILGYTPAEWLAEPTFWADHVHPDDREATLAEFTRAATDGDRFDVEYRFLAKDGTTVWLRDLGHAVNDADGAPIMMRGLMVRVTGRKDLEAEGREAESRFRRVVERIPAIVYIEGAMVPGATTGPMLYISPQVHDILGFSAEEWVADPYAFSRQFHPEDRDRIEREYRRIETTGDPFSVDYRMFARDGRVVWFHDEAVLVRDPDGTPLFWQGILYDVSAQRETELIVSETEARYQTLVEQLPAVVYSEPVFGNELSVMYISPRVERVLGISQEEWQANPLVWLDSMHPDDRDRITAENERTEATGEPFVADYRSIARDGRVVWFHDEATLVRDPEGQPLFWQGVMIDITALKDTQAQLAEAEARYRAIVEQTPAISYIDAVEKGAGTLYISPQTTTLLGYMPEEWYADPDLWSTIVHPGDAGHRDATNPDAPHSSEYRIVAKDGSIVWVHDQASLILDEAGDPKFWEGVLVDITQQKRAEELERALHAERETAQRLRDVDEMKNTFLQAVSHDLRTPLAAILGLAVTMEREDLELDAPEIHDMSGRIAQNARKLDRLVSDLLDLDRLSRGIIEPSLRETDIGELVHRIVNESDIVSQRTVKVEVQRVVVPADPAKVERIVENLLSNTVRHTPRDASVWVRVEPQDDGALITVEDDGHGVALEVRGQIFEPFRQGYDAPTHSPGVGVGLTLVARFAELQGGRAWVEERDGGGASFKVFLSGSPEEAIAAARAQAAIQRAGESSSSPDASQA
jgi:PAS domain S-box-containing protein